MRDYDADGIAHTAVIGFSECLRLAEGAPRADCMPRNSCHDL